MDSGCRRLYSTTRRVSRQSVSLPRSRQKILMPGFSFIPCLRFPPLQVRLEANGPAISPTVRSTFPVSMTSPKPRSAESCKLSRRFALHESYVLWGSSGHAKVLLGIIGRLGGRVLATFDNNPTATPLAEIPLYIGQAGFEQWLAETGDVRDVRALVAIGGRRGRDRIDTLARMTAAGLKAEPLIDPRASIDATAKIGGGTQVLPGAVVSADAVVGQGCILNHKASVDHECQVGSGVHLAPAATLCGLVSVGGGAMIAK